MATIVQLSTVCDGYDAIVTLQNGRTHTFHFATMPADLHAAVDAAELPLIQEAEAVTLADAKTAKKAALLTQYDALLTAGVTVGGITLAATPADRAAYTSLVTMEHLAVSLNQRTVADTSGLADIYEVWHAMTVQEVFALLLQYGAACEAMSADYSAKVAAIQSATSLEQLEAISL